MEQMTAAGRVQEGGREGEGRGRQGGREKEGGSRGGRGGGLGGTGRCDNYYAIAKQHKAEPDNLKLSYCSTTDQNRIERSELHLMICTSIKMGTAWQLHGTS